MAPKKAAKKSAKSAKKVAKKAAKKTPGNKLGQDTRRCYEHFGRVSTLLRQVPEKETVARLVALGQELLRLGSTKEAADALRAAEHLSFGSLAMHGRADDISDVLLEALQTEYHDLLDRAGQRAADHELTGPAARLFATLRRMAAVAFKAKQYRAASELARGAEALTHIHTELTTRLRAPELRRLEA